MVWQLKMDTTAVLCLNKKQIFIMEILSGWITGWITPEASLKHSYQCIINIF